MKGTRLPALILIAVLVGLTAAVVAVVNPVGRPSPIAGPSTSPVPSVPERQLSVAQVVAVGEGPRFDFRAVRGYPTSEVPQSKLWFHDGAWWGMLVADGTNEFRIHRLDWAAQEWVDTGVPMAQRVVTPPDVLAHEEKLYVATGGGDPRGRRGASLFRYTYDGEARRYTLDPDFPVPLATDIANFITIARDADGRLWISYISAGSLFVSHTDGNDLLWRAPAEPAIEGLELEVDAAVIVAFEDSVALLWSNVAHDRITFAVAEVDAEGVESWERREIVVEGLQHADDHINVAVLDEDGADRLFVAVKTSLDELEPQNELDPQVQLLVREPDGSWLQYQVGRVDDRHSRPIVLLDGENRVVYVVAISPFSGGGIYYKVADMDRISFPTGLGTEMIRDPIGPTVSSPTSTKQNIDSETGMVVLASDSTTGRYFHAAALVEGGGEGLDRTPVEYPQDEPRRLLFDTFDPFPDGMPVANAWEVRDDGVSTFQVTPTDDGRRVAGISSEVGGGRARMCKELPPVSTGQLRVETEVWLSAVGDSDAVMAAVRHQGVQSAALQFSRRAIFSYVDGDAVVRSELPYQLATWYRAIMTVDLDSRTYDWQIQRVSDGAVVLQGSGSLPSLASGPADEVCVQSPTPDLAPVTFLVDSVKVEHTS